MANYWYTGGAPITSKSGAGGLGTHLAALYFGGAVAGAPSVESEEYNGTSWSAGADYGTALKFVSGCGTTSAGLGAGGHNNTDAVKSTYEYNGTSWAAANDMINARRSHPTFGTQTAGCAAGGLHDTTAWRTQSEEYDGTSWTAGNAITNSHVDGTYGGTQTAGLAVAGQNSGGRITSVEEYNGTSWAAGGAVSTAIYRLGGFGSQTAFIRCGGDETGPALTKAESYNGTSWTTENSMPAGKTFNAGAGDATNGLTVSSTVTYEWDPYNYGSGSISALSDITGSAGLLFQVSGLISALSSIIGTGSKVGQVEGIGSITAVSSITGNAILAIGAAGSIAGAAVITATGNILNELYLLVTGFASGQTVEYRIKDNAGDTIQDWTSTGVNEDLEITGKSTYFVKVKLNSGFQGKISWRIQSTSYYAVEGINHFELLLAQLNSLPTLPQIEASSVLAKEATVNTRLAAASYTAPDNAGIGNILTETQSHPTLAEMLAGGVAKEATLTAVKAKTDNLPQGVAKNTALNNFTFSLISALDGKTGLAGAAVTAKRSIDGGAFASCANSVSEIGSGAYKINFAASDLNGDVICFLFTAPNAIDRVITILTQT